MESLRDTIKRELPDLLREDPELRAFILELTRPEYAGHVETENRFDKVLAELRQDREEQNRKWWEYNREQNHKWEEQNRKLDEQNRKWWEYNRKQNHKWEEQNHKWEEQNRKWDESSAHFERVHEEIMAQAKEHERAIGALGARWGLQSEATFRNALAGVLEKHFDVQVVRVEEFDDEGMVFGRPDQVELDVIVKNGLLIICELKSSMDKAGMYAFERKARFYEQRHNRKANRLLAISPMIDPRARKVAERLGIEMYSDSEDVDRL